MKLRTLFGLALVGFLMSLAVACWSQTPDAATAPAAGNAIAAPADGANFIVDLATKYPWVVTVVAIIGTLRLLVKPVIAAAHSYAESTNSPKAEALIEKIENSKLLSTVFFVLDWFGSVKVRK